MLKGLSKADDNDIIIFSDADEIPNLTYFNEQHKRKLLRGSVGIFLQYLYYYKLNILTSSKNHWEGSRAILKKYLKSFKKLRSIVLKNSFFYLFGVSINLKKFLRLIKGVGISPI